MQDVNKAVDEWVRTMGPLVAAGHRVCGPSVASDLNWLISFTNICKARTDCPMFDCVQAHVYQTDPNAVIGYLVSWLFPSTSVPVA